MAERQNSIITRSFLIWLAIVPAAILNGIFRETVLVFFVGTSVALPLSGLLLCGLILLISVLGMPFLGKVDGPTCKKIGLFWMMLTIGFEFGFGYFSGKTGQELLSAYDPRTGNLWLLIIIFVSISPWLGAKIRKII